MMLSANKIMGSLIYRTRKALRGNNDFLEVLRGYKYAANCFIGGQFNLWHYPGTHAEISGAFREVNIPEYKFPCLLNFQTIRQNVDGYDVTLHYSLAFVAPTFNNWRTEQREAQVFDKVLRPIYEEFMRQVAKCEYFTPVIGIPPHDRYEVYTTGENAESIKSIYGDHLDALEIHDLSLSLNHSVCKRRIEIIEKENDLVTKNIKNNV